jgi:hypothetical protein
MEILDLFFAGIEFYSTPKAVHLITQPLRWLRLQELYVLNREPRANLVSITPSNTELGLRDSSLREFHRERQPLRRAWSPDSTWPRAKVELCEK